MKRQQQRFNFPIALTMVCALTLFYGCEDTASIKGSASPPDIQTPGAARQGNLVLQQPDTTAVIEGEYIVRFRDQFGARISEQVARQVDQFREEVLATHNIRKDSVISRYRYAIQGFSAKLSNEQVEALRRDSRIAKVSPNGLLKLAISGSPITARPAEKENPAPNALASSQTTPWGVTRVGGPLNGARPKGLDSEHGHRPGPPGSQCG